MAPWFSHRLGGLPWLPVRTGQFRGLKFRWITVGDLEGNVWLSLAAELVHIP